MAEQYFAANPTAAHDERQVVFRVIGQELRCVTDAGVFSREGLDMGTRVLLEALPELRGRVLDLGCGWGPVGCALGRRDAALSICMSDVNLRAVELARRNLQLNGVANAQAVQSDGFAALEGAFDAIVLNPPIRSGKAAIYALFADAAKHLTANGALYIVIRKQQGAESAQRYLQTIYARVERIAREKGYWVLRCAAPAEAAHEGR